MAIISNLAEYAEQPTLFFEPLKDSQIRITGLAIYEAVMGVRPIDQLLRLVAPQVVNQVVLQRSLNTDRQTIYKTERRVVPIPGRVTASKVSDLKINAVLVMHEPQRSVAVALCFELLHVGWRATEAYVV